MRRTPQGGFASRLRAALGGQSSREVVPAPRPTADGVVVHAETWRGADGDPWPSNWTGRSITGPGTSTIHGNRGRQQADPGLAWRGNLIDGPDLGDQEVLVSFEVGDPKREQFADVGYRMGTGSDDPNVKAGNGYVLELEHPWDAGRLWVFDARREGRGDGWNELAAVHPAGLSEGGRYWIRIRAVGGRHRARWWRDGHAEPDEWLIDVVDETHAAGRNWLVTYGGKTTSGQVDWDDLTVSELITPT